MKLDTRLVSSLDKVFLDEAPEEAKDLYLEGFENEVQSFQIAYCNTEGDVRAYIQAAVESPIADHVTLRRVGHVPVRFTTFPDSDDNYLRNKPGLYPDVLKPIIPHSLRAWLNQWDTLWIDIEKGLEPGVYPVDIVFYAEEGREGVRGEELCRRSVNVTVLKGKLPDQKLIQTRWFYGDCLANFYHIPVFSEDWWRICENFIKRAVDRGINMILMPIHTPPLDTRVGSERTTVQLVNVNLNAGKYTFAFDKLSRWVEMCKRCGVEYYEVAHMFTQWGANFTPNIYASVDGTYKRIFGWDKSSTGDEYKEFLDAYLPALKKAFTDMGIADKCFFHVSDEPSVDHLESYLNCKALLEKHLAGFKFIDALSDITFYNSGAVKKPVPATNHIKPFLDANIDGLWAYYCIGQYKDVSNSFAYMPSARTRILGAQLFKYDIEGFLQWGYNFYNSQFSDYPIDPYYSGDCEGFGPTGDAFQVYPGYDGMPEDSLRLMVVFHGMQDLRAMQLLASLTDKKTVVDMIDAEGEVEFDKYPKSKEYIFELRRKINKAIVEASK